MLHKKNTAELNKQVVLLSADDRALIKIVQRGLPVVSRPYAEIAKQLNTSEQDIISRLQKFINDGAIKRYGVVVRHKELGYNANGMVVWNIPDDRIDELGHYIGKYDCVTLCYRRPRRLPDWSYNLFTMVHGKDREQVTQKVSEIISQCGLEDIEHDILFSSRRFKQRGARYTESSSLEKHSNTTSKLHLVK